MYCGDSRTGDAEANTQKGHGNRIEEDTNEKAKRHYGAAEQDTQGRPRGEEEVGSKDGEGKDEPTCDLVDRCIDVLEGIVAETGGWAQESMSMQN